MLVVVNGPPAAGKTTLARVLSHRLALPLLSKDELKESLFDSLGTGDRAWSRSLGAATFELLYLLAGRLLDAGASAILEGNFDAPHLCPRLDELRARSRCRVVEVYLHAPDDVLRRRFRARARTAGRHPGHLDDVVARELAARVHAGRWRPLPCVDERVDVDASSTGAETARRAVAEVARALGPRLGCAP